MGMDNGSRNISRWVIGSVLFGIVSVFAILILVVVTGTVNTDVSVSADISLVGTIPIGYLLMTILGFVGWMVYIAFMDIYDSEEVKQSFEEVSDITEDN